MGISSIMSSSKFNTLSYELKRAVVRESGLGVHDLLALSHTNHLWREVSIEDDIFDQWYMVSTYCTLRNLPSSCKMVLASAALASSDPR